MNDEHLKRCSSAEWADTVERWIIPWVLDGIDLGEDVLELGPGPGLTTDVLRARVPRLTAVEVDPALAGSLAARLAGTNVDLVCADASQTSLPSGRFSGAVCLTMLHHVESMTAQDAVFSEVHRLLRSGGVLVGQDSLGTPELRELHEGDVYVPVDPEGLASRLEAAGFGAVDVTTNEYAVRFRATKPAERAH